MPRTVWKLGSCTVWSLLGVKLGINLFDEKVGSSSYIFISCPRWESCNDVRCMYSHMIHWVNFTYKVIQTVRTPQNEIIAINILSPTARLPSHPNWPPECNLSQGSFPNNTTFGSGQQLTVVASRKFVEIQFRFDYAFSSILLDLPRSVGRNPTCGTQRLW